MGFIGWLMTGEHSDHEEEHSRDSPPKQRSQRSVSFRQEEPRSPRQEEHTQQGAQGSDSSSNGLHTWFTPPWITERVNSMKRARDQANRSFKVGVKRAASPLRLIGEARKQELAQADAAERARIDAATRSRGRIYFGIACALGVGFLATAALGGVVMATIAGDLHAALRAHPCSGSCVEADGNERTRACVANATCAPSNATCAAVGCCRNQLLLTPANCVGVEVRASDWMDVFAADDSSGGAIALVAVGTVGAMAMALLAKTIGEEMLAWDKLSSARRRSLMFRTSRSLGSLPRAGRSQELPRWEVDTSGVCVCRSSNS